jgi:hypothetical protein
MLTGLWWHGGSAQGGAGWPGQGPCAVPSAGVGSVGMVGGMAGSPSNNTVRILGTGKHRMNTAGCESSVKEEAKKKRKKKRCTLEVHLPPPV